jgi:uncharacterized membrane protein
MKTKLDNGTLYSMCNNPINWKGRFYVNPKDPRVFVPKIKSTYDWSLNFAKPISYVLITSIVLAAFALIFLKK